MSAVEAVPLVYTDGLSPLGRRVTTRVVGYGLLLLFRGWYAAARGKPAAAVRRKLLGVERVREHVAQHGDAHPADLLLILSIAHMAPRYRSRLLRQALPA